MTISYFNDLLIKCSCKFLCFISIFLLLHTTLQAQVTEKGKFKKDLKIKGNKGNQKDTARIQNTENKNSPKDSLSHSHPATWFELPKKEPSLLNEDTALDMHNGETETVVVTQEVRYRYDTNWVKVAEYFKHWDTYNIDPYNKKPAEFRDTVLLRLYDAQRYWSFPLNRCNVTSPFAYRWGRWHFGTDLALNTGDSVKAAFDGVVRIVRWDAGGYGYFVLLRHYNGLETLYGHLSKQLVVPEQYVKAGDLIGLGGSTGMSSGPHLHYETRYQGDAFNPGYIYDYQKEGMIRSDTFQLTKDKYSYAFYKAPVYNRYNYAYNSPVDYRFAVYHIIKSGDVLGSIAARYRTSVYNICLLNGIGANTVLRIGRRLRVK